MFVPRLVLAFASVGVLSAVGCNSSSLFGPKPETLTPGSSSSSISKYPDTEPLVVRGQMFPPAKSTDSDKSAEPYADIKPKKPASIPAVLKNEAVFDDQVKPASVPTTMPERMGASKPTAITAGGVSPGECKVLPVSNVAAVPAHPGITGARTGSKFEWDPHSRSMPTATGLYINQGPYDSAFERAVELGLKVQSLDGENAELRGKIRQLEALVENRERLLRDDEQELSKATEDVVKARAELESVRKDFAKLKARLRQVEKEDLETLRSIVTALEKLLERLPQ